MKNLIFMKWTIIGTNHQQNIISKTKHIAVAIAIIFLLVQLTACNLIPPIQDEKAPSLPRTDVLGNEKEANFNFKSRKRRNATSTTASYVDGGWWEDDEDEGLFPGGGEFNIEGEDDFLKLYKSLYKGPVCGLIDVRNSPVGLKDLENCTVVNGYVQILFMHNSTEKDFTKYRFPKLRVITEYLLVFRVHGLRSLRHMFPNLAVIEGRHVFYDYAMVIYENPHLTELGLGNLTLVARGAVRIQKNNQLCYLSSVDWERLGQIGHFRNKKLQDSKIINNQADECDICSNQCPSQCASVDTTTAKVTPHCWGVNVCQKKSCPTECPFACREDKCDCHSECRVGCSKPNSAQHCTICLHKYNNGTCVNKCPKGLLEMDGWNCVTPSYCSWVNWVVHENKCLIRCPSGYTDHQLVDGRWVCVRCKGQNCKKVCGGSGDVFKVTDLLTDLQDVIGCTEIPGRLEISVKGGADIINEIVDALSDLQSVGALVVQRSSALVSLGILKNLQRITGQTDALKNGIYSVYVLNNENLKYLWDFNSDAKEEKSSRKKKNRKNNKDRTQPSRKRRDAFKTGDRKLTIDGGKAFFHFNSQLCASQIKRISDLTEKIEDNTDISETTNGDRASCDMTELHVISMTGFPHRSSGARQMIMWEQVAVDDTRTLLGYQLYYKESPNKTASKFEGVYACGETSWEIADKLMIGNSDNNDSKNQSMVLDGLKPFTQYALYISTYTTLSANRGAQSKIVYFTTKSTTPSEPRDVLAHAVNSSTISIEWIPPKFENGIITHYEVRWRRQAEYLEPVMTIDTCETGFDRSPRPLPFSHEVEEEEIARSKASSENKNVEFSEDNSIKALQHKAEDSQRFEDLLHARMFGSRNDEGDGFDETLARKRRGVGDSFVNEMTTRPTSTMLFNFTTQASGNSTSLLPEVTAYNDIASPTYPWVSKTVDGTNTTITDLHHFSEYDIQVIACNHAYNDTDVDKKGNVYKIGCSYEALTSKRTMANHSADAIPSFQSTPLKEKIEEDDKNIEMKYSVLEWEKPSDPNGYIKFYMIEYMLQDEKSPRKSEKQCFSVRDFVANGQRYEISRTLGHGKYKARVMPVSLSGKGNWTNYVYFTVGGPPSSDAWIQRVWIIMAVIGILLVAAVILTVQCFVKKRATLQRNAITVASVNPEYAQVYVPDGYEIDIADVELLKQIGHGHFGKVYEGIAKSIIRGQEQTRVAIKKLHGDASISRRIEFLQEADVMKSFNSHHVVRLLGVISQAPEAMVIMELMCNGDLKSYLRSRREDVSENPKNIPPPTLQEKLQMCAEIADGMMYLSANKFVHRDIAARNCLVHESGTVKIGDFGLTRDIYATDYYRKDSRGFLPIRWMSPESLKDGLFDSASDVWSYGIVLWEISTLAEQPYQGRAHDEVTRFVIDGGYMERPNKCPKKLYDIMLMCWEYRPAMRPTFAEIIESLLNDVSDHFKHNCFYYEQRAKNDKAEQIAQLLLQRGNSVHSGGVSSRQPTPCESCHTPASRNSNCSVKSNAFGASNRLNDGASSSSNESKSNSRSSPKNNNRLNNHSAHNRSKEDNYYTVKSSDSENSFVESRASRSDSPSSNKEDDNDDYYASLLFNKQAELNSPEDVSRPLLNPQPEPNQRIANGYHTHHPVKDSKYFESNLRAPSPPVISPPTLPKHTLT